MSTRIRNLANEKRNHVAVELGKPDSKWVGYPCQAEGCGFPQYLRKLEDLAAGPLKRSCKKCGQVQYAMTSADWENGVTVLWEPQASYAGAAVPVTPPPVRASDAKEWIAAAASPPPSPDGIGKQAVSEDAVGAAVGHALGAVVNDALAKALADVDARIEAVAKAQGRTVIEVKATCTDTDYTVPSDRHPAYEDMLDVISVGQNPMLVGPAGSGKTTLVRHLAEDLKRRFHFQPCTAGLSEAHIFGRMNAHGEYIQSAVVDVWENGGVLLLDEFDAMDANVSVGLNEALNSGSMSLPNRPEKPLAERHADTVVAVACNTFGNGLSMEYAGRNQLDGATLDRFAMTRIFVDYQTELEEAWGEKAKAQVFVHKLQTIRAKCKETKVRRICSTRAIIQGCELRMHRPEKYTDDVLMERFFLGWTEQERAKVSAS